MISEFGSTEMSKELSYNQDEFCNFTQTHEPKLNGDQSTKYYAILHPIHSSQGVFRLLMHVVALKQTSTPSNTSHDPFPKKCNCGCSIIWDLLDGGKNAHSAFKKPLDLRKPDYPSCIINLGTANAAIIGNAKIIVWDEAP